MEKLNARIVSQIKNIFKANEADYGKIEKLENKAKELIAEAEAIKIGVNLSESKVRIMTGGTVNVDGSVSGGFTSDQLVEAVITPKLDDNGNAVLDKNGYPMKSKSYVLKYPDTVLPPAEEPAQTSELPDGETETVAPAEVPSDSEDSTQVGQGMSIETPNI